MTTVFEQPWNLLFQADAPVMVRPGTVLFQKTLKDVVPSPLPLPLAGAYLLHPTSGDFEILAALMQAAYSLDDHIFHELCLRMRGYFLSSELRPALASSWMCFVDGTLVSACLIALPHGSKTPYVTEWITAIPWQRKGLGTALLQKTLHSLVENGFRVVRLTCSNTGSPMLRRLEKMGFFPIPSLAPKN